MDITTVPAFRRNIGVVFQNYALFPHLTVSENVAFGLKANGVDGPERKRRVAECLDLVRLPDFGKRNIHNMSGGQQQRVAIARALAIRPKLLLLDEPLSALDRKLRDTMQVELRQLFKSLGSTVIFVTHDQDEAMGLSDRIAVMKDGGFEQIADPATLYTRPASAFVLDFIGQSNRFQGIVGETRAGRLTLDTPLGLLKARGSFRRGSKVVVGIRPESIKITDQTSSVNRTEGTLVDWLFQGSRVCLLFQIDQVEQLLRAETNGSEVTGRLFRGARQTLTWSDHEMLLFPQQ